MRTSFSETFVEQKSSAGDDTVAVEPLLEQATSLRVDPRLDLLPCESAVA